MKLKDNALEIARNLEVISDQRPHILWHHLMEYENSDWAALEYMCKKYRPKSICYLNKEYYDKESRSDWDWEPSMFLCKLKNHLFYRKQLSTRELIVSEIETLFDSHYKCADIMKEVFDPVIALNASRKRLMAYQNEVTQITKNVEKITQGLESNDDLELFVCRGSD